MGSVFVWGGGGGGSWWFLVRAVIGCLSGSVCSLCDLDTRSEGFGEAMVLLPSLNEHYSPRFFYELAEKRTLFFFFLVWFVFVSACTERYTIYSSRRDNASTHRIPSQPKRGNE